MLGIEVKSGATRHVLLVWRWAIKVPRVTRWTNFLQGLLANMQEVAFAPISGLLCPVLWAARGGWILVMPRAEPLTDGQWAKLRPEHDHDLIHAGFPLGIEAKRDSFGVLAGRVVAVDYGS